jgi:hypothetical protein
MSVEFDTTELDQFTKDLLDLARVKLPQESKKFVRKEQGKLRTRTRQKARSKVHKKTGNLFKNIDRSKVYDNGDDIVGKVYIRGGKGGAPHAHLIEDGHRIVGHLPGKKDTGKEAPAFKIMEEARNEFEPVFAKDCEEFVDEALREKGL